MKKIEKRKLNLYLGLLTLTSCLVFFNHSPSRKQQAPKKAFYIYFYNENPKKISLEKVIEQAILDKNRNLIMEYWIILEKIIEKNTCKLSRTGK